MISLLPILTAALLQTPALPDALQAEFDLLHKTNSVTGSMEVNFGSGRPQTFAFKLLKPKLYQVIGPYQEFRFDGTQETTLTKETNQYVVSNRAPNAVADAPLLNGFEPFFTTDPPVFKVRQAMDAQLNAVDVKEFVLGFGDSPDTITLFVDPKTHLPAGWVQMAGTRKVVAVYKDLKLNPELDPKDPGWSVPKTAKPDEHVDPVLRLIPTGVTLPTFAAQTLSNQPFDLLKTAGKSKATILVFWTADSPSATELMALQAVYEKLHDKGLEIVAINRGDDKPKVQAIVENAKLAYPMIVDTKELDLTHKFGVVAFPSNYVLDASGTVIDRFVEYDPMALDKDLRKLGF